MIVAALVAVVDFLLEAAQSSPVPAAAAALIAFAVDAPEEVVEASMMVVAFEPW